MAPHGPEWAKDSMHMKNIIQSFNKRQSGSEDPAKSKAIMAAMAGAMILALASCSGGGKAPEGPQGGQKDAQQGAQNVQATNDGEEAPQGDAKSESYNAEMEVIRKTFGKQSDEFIDECAKRLDATVPQAAGEEVKKRMSPINKTACQCQISFVIEGLKEENAKKGMGLKDAVKDKDTTLISQSCVINIYSQELAAFAKENPGKAFDSDPFAKTLKDLISAHSASVYSNSCFGAISHNIKGMNGEEYEKNKEMMGKFTNAICSCMAVPVMNSFDDKAVVNPGLILDKIKANLAPEIMNSEFSRCYKEFVAKAVKATQDAKQNQQAKPEAESKK